MDKTKQYTNRKYHMKVCRQEVKNLNSIGTYIEKCNSFCLFKMLNECKMIDKLEQKQ